MSEQPSGPADDVVLNGRYRIFPEKPVPIFDTPTASALEAADERASGRSLIALVCKPGLIPRLDIIPQLSRLTRLPMINPVDAGAVAWPDSGGRRFVVLFERTGGEALAKSLDARFTPLREDQVEYKVISPLLPALKELSGRAIRHRAIRADNVFYADASRQSALLGECVSGPTGMSQPVLYEPIDAAIANPSGRGPGTLYDDLYAFGVLIVVLLSGGNPVAEMSDEEIIDAKIRNGSYTALVQDLRVSLSIMEPLRGLLCDDPKERWTVSDLELWAGGRQLSPKQPMLPIKASRSISFAGTEFWTRPALSFAMGRHWGQAGSLVSSGDLVDWLRRSFGDEESANTLQSLPATPGVSSHNEDRLISRALVVLEPGHPLRYRGVSARIEGLPMALAIEYGDGDFRRAFSELMQAKLPQAFLQSVSGKGPEQGPLMKSFDMITYLMERPQIGSGLERALYESNRGWPCQSPLIADDYVCEISDLLPAMERAVRQGSAGGEPLDRHIAAFCAARIKTMPESTLRDLNVRGNLSVQRLAMLRLFAEVQKITGPKQRFPALTAWLAALMTPVIESFHNRAHRARLSASVERVGGKGSLLELLAVLADNEAWSRDANGFVEARGQYAEFVKTIAWLEGGGLASRDYVISKSRQASTVLSAMIASLTIIVLTILFVA